MIHRLLLVEDNAAEQEIIRQRLMDARHLVQFELSCESRLDRALEYLANNEADIVLLDLTLPDSSGVETCQQIRSQFPDLPLVVMTGRSDESIALRSIQLGAQDFLFKDRVDELLLVRTLAYAIERKQFQQTLLANEQQAIIKQHQSELTHLSRLSLMGEMASGIAHELNQPLTALVGYSKSAQSLLDREVHPNEDLRAVLALITQQSHRSAEIIRGLRSLVQKRPRVRTPLELHDVVQSVCRLVGYAKSEDLRIVEVVSFQDELLVSADRVQIEQVVINLLRNSLDAVRGQMKPRVEMSLGRHDNSATIVVSDNGPELDQETLERLFEPYFSTKEDGLGMGLSVSRSIIEDHGGVLSAKALVDGGIAMKVELPLSQQDG